MVNSFPVAAVARWTAESGPRPEYPEGTSFRAHPEGTSFRAHPEGTSFRAHPEGTSFRAHPEGTYFRAHPEGTFFRALAEDSQPRISMSSGIYCNLFIPGR
ncbi:MAG: hypothetical protein U9R36_02775 [Elusimicrobiota bacterium]|nr:hypothetical protein [Elusimicrobiota bacterium]